MMRFIFISLLLCLPLSAMAETLKGKEANERIFIVTEYRYIAANAADDQEIGHSLCGTRCNALSANYRNILEPGGWSLTRVSSNQEISVELKNPFIGGYCICSADEYHVKSDDRIKFLKAKGSVPRTF